MQFDFNGQIPVLLNHGMIFLLVSAWSRALFTQPTNVILSTFISFFLTIIVSLSFLKIVLKGLKQATSKGWSAWDVFEGKIIMLSPKSLVCSIASRVTWDPCPSKINRCLLVRDTSPSINLLKKDKTHWKGR